MSDRAGLPRSYDEDISREPDDVACSETDEAPGRIRWERAEYGTSYGSVGPHRDLFAIHWRTQRNQPDWILRTRLTSRDGDVAKDNDLDALKATAETWLAEFVASLGAVFPEPGAAAYAATHPVLCAHADDDGQGAHWLEPGEKCGRESAP